MRLKYCPTCREDLPDPLTSWICRQRRRPNAIREGIDPAELQRGVITGGMTESLPYQDDASLCLQYNEDGQVCSKESCAKPRVARFSVSACPHCREEIPKLPKNVDGRTFTVTGVSGAGKTHYLVAITDWSEMNLSRFGLSCRPAMSEKVAKGFKMLRDTIFGQGRTVGQTTAGKSISYTWLIQPDDRTKPGMLLSMPDASGESLKQLNQVEANRHYDFTRGVVLLLDGERLIDRGRERAGAAEELELVQTMVNWIDGNVENEDGEAGEGHDFPIAVCINKCDLVYEEDREWKAIASDPDHVPYHEDANQSGAFDYLACERRSDAIRDLLYANRKTAGIVGLLESHFAPGNVMYFVTASLGSEKKEGLEIRPIAVQDPFLFLLWRNEYIRGIGRP